METIRFIDLFAGIGGFRYGLQKVAIKPKDSPNNKSGTSQHGQHAFYCVWSNEWDKYASQIYKKHYGEIDTRDITKVPSSEIPDHDLLCGGFPCQAFSIAGKRRGFEDTRGTLFFEIARILADKRPRYFLLENVRGLLSHDKGKTFQTILGVLTNLGYEYQWQVLNSKNFGVPQNRERVFIVGHLRGTPRPKVFPVEGTNGETYKKLKYRGAIMSEKNKKWLEEDEKELSRNFPQGQRVYDASGIASTIAGNAGGLGGKTGLYQVSKTVRSGGRKSPYGSKQNWDSYKLNGAIRRLTPTECERLQGFPDGWTEGISDTQRYKCLGNAVTTNVVTWIGERLYLSIDKI